MSLHKSYIMTSLGPFQDLNFSQLKSLINRWYAQIFNSIFFYVCNSIINQTLGTARIAHINRDHKRFQQDMCYGSSLFGGGSRLWSHHPQARHLWCISFMCFFFLSLSLCKIYELTRFAAVCFTMTWNKRKTSCKCRCTGFYKRCSFFRVSFI